MSEGSARIASWHILVIGFSYLLVLDGASIFRWVHSNANYSPLHTGPRRFSSFADRTIVNGILKSAPGRTPVAFIAYPRDRIANWDPLVWSLFGLRIIYLSQKLPSQRRTTDGTWRTPVAELITKALCVSINLSVSSASIEEELAMVSMLAERDRIVAIASEGIRHATEQGSVERSAPA